MTARICAQERDVQVGSFSQTSWQEDVHIPHCQSDVFIGLCERLRPMLGGFRILLGDAQVRARPCTRSRIADVACFQRFFSSLCSLRHLFIDPSVRLRTHKGWSDSFQKCIKKIGLREWRLHGVIIHRLISLVRRLPAGRTRERRKAEGDALDLDYYAHELIAGELPLSKCQDVHAIALGVRLQKTSFSVRQSKDEDLFEEGHAIVSAGSVERALRVR